MQPPDAVQPSPEVAFPTVYQLYISLSKSYPSAVTNFENLYAAWKESWKHPSVRLSSRYEIAQEQALGPLTNIKCCSMSARTQGQEYDALVELGPATIPLVVRKLAEPDEFFAVGLCESDLIIP